MNSALIKRIENFFHSILSSAETEIVDYATPAIKFIEANGGKAILTLAETVLAGLAPGTPWTAVISSLITVAETQGIALAEDPAKVILNYAQSNMTVNGTTAGAAIVTPPVV